MTAGPRRPRWEIVRDALAAWGARGLDADRRAVDPRLAWGLTLLVVCGMVCVVFPADDGLDGHLHLDPARLVDGLHQAASPAGAFPLPGGAPVWSRAVAGRFAGGSSLRLEGGAPAATGAPATLFVVARLDGDGAPPDECLLLGREPDGRGLGITCAAPAAGAPRVFRGFAGGGALAGSAAPEPVRIGRWYHLLLTTDGREGRLYVNGRLAAAGPAGPVAPAGDLAIRSRPGGALFSVLQAGVYARALSAEAAAAAFQLLTRPGPDGGMPDARPPGGGDPSGLWRFDRSGSRVVDRAPHGCRAIPDRVEIGDP